MRLFYALLTSILLLFLDCILDSNRRRCSHNSGRCIFVRCSSSLFECGPSTPDHLDVTLPHFCGCARYPRSPTSAGAVGRMAGYVGDQGGYCVGGGHEANCEISFVCFKAVFSLVSAQPAIKLQAFFASQAASDKVAREGGLKDREAAGLASLSTTKAQAASSTLRDLPPVDCEDVGRWVAYWRSKGFM